MKKTPLREQLIIAMIDAMHEYDPEIMKALTGEGYTRLADAVLSVIAK